MKTSSTSFRSALPSGERGIGGSKVCSSIGSWLAKGKLRKKLDQRTLSVRGPAPEKKENTDKKKIAMSVRENIFKEKM